MVASFVKSGANTFKGNLAKAEMQTLKLEISGPSFLKQKLPIIQRQMEHLIIQKNLLLSRHLSDY